VCIEFDELVTDDEPPKRLREWVHCEAVRLHPPKRFPRGVVDLLREGDVVELLYEVRVAHTCARTEWGQFVEHCTGGVQRFGATGTRDPASCFCIAACRMAGGKL
jgi:hypothetical protein